MPQHCQDRKPPVCQCARPSPFFVNNQQQPKEPFMKELTLNTTVKVYSPEELDAETLRLITEARQAAVASYAPYSNFHVGAAVMLNDNTIIKGNNQENAAYPSGLCAERTALFYAHALYPRIPVSKIAIAACQNEKFTRLPVTPCGACRQVMAEYTGMSDTAMQVILYGTESIYIIDDARELLPLTFKL